MENLSSAWNALRSVLQNSFSFYDIKQIVGLAGLDLARISHLEQKQGGGASKGQLMTGVDQALPDFDREMLKRFVGILAEEMLTRRSDVRPSIELHLARLGYDLVDTAVIPLELLDTTALPELPQESRADLKKAAQRLRDGDLSGALSAACAAVDSTTSAVYAAAGLGDPAKASFQERCKRALKARGVLPSLEDRLCELGWTDRDGKLLKKNFAGALNQGAYVMQTLRSKMGDVHGTKPILKPMVFDCIKWAELMLRALMDE